VRTVFLRALEVEDKATVLRAAIRNPEEGRGETRFEVDLASFVVIPRSPFAYWISAPVRSLFSRLPPFEMDGRTVKQGLATTDDFRFVRTWWEVPYRESGKRWFPLAKGGAFSPFYADMALCMDWLSDGAQSWAIYEARRDVVGGIMKNPDYYFRPGLTYPRRLHRFAVMPLPAGSIFSVRGSGIFAERGELLRIAGLLSSSSFDFLVKCMLGRFGHPQFDNGTLCKVPVPTGLPKSAEGLEHPARRAVSLKRSLDTRTENSHAFTLPALLQVEGATLVARVAAWAELVRRIESEVAAIQAEIDERSFELYEIDEADRDAIAEGFGASADASTEAVEPDAELDNDLDEEDEPEGDADTVGLVAELVSWAVGVAVGRFDVQVATGARALPAEPEPFDPLPVCSPAMLTGEDGLPLASAPIGYPVNFPMNGLLVDDPGHPRDLTAAVRAVFETVFGAQADALWQEAAALLDPKDRDLQGWLAVGFFGHHLRRHSKSRRKAPIVWQLGVPTGRYSVWLYAHRLTRDSAFQLQNDVVVPKLAHEERQLTSLVQQAGRNPSAKERKAIAEKEALVEELRALLDEVKRVAPLWNPMLDDGVVLTMAPLWRLVPQYKPWQRELKSKWDDLCAGQYDWAHLGMHLWPERVVPKCATDRSLAIAHGLEEVFWTEGSDGKWQPRATPLQPVEALVRERSSPAVKAALASLIEAPTIPGGRGRGRRNGTTITTGGVG
jgi:hypothetical protein